MLVERFVLCFLSTLLLGLPVRPAASDDYASLIAFRASANRSNSLVSWLDWSDPCAGSWLGVGCDHRTRRVTRLVLDNLGLAGSIRALTRLDQLRVLSLNNNALSDSSLNLSCWPRLKHLYLSGNFFGGEFPAGASTSHRLRRVDLSRNRFSGGIPLEELSRLRRLLTLRLEGNKFNGSLGPAGALPSVLDLNVSNNDLSGEIPAWMIRFPATSFFGNPKLCGRPLSRACSDTAPAEPAEPTDLDLESPEGRRKPSRKLRNRVVLTVVILDAAAAVAAVATITWCCWRRRRQSRPLSGAQKNLAGGDGILWYGPFDGRPREEECGEMVMLEGCKGFGHVEDLLRSTADMLGKGCVGTTYRVELVDSGGAVVVKRVRERERRRWREVGGWLRQIGELRHPNVVSLRAYYHSKDELLLVYDYLPNGSLHALLHGNRGPGRTPLDWTTRLKLALDSAKGLAFLSARHHKSKLFHGHITPSNILVDDSGNACMADFGLHQLLSPPLSLNTAYTAPELMPGGGGQSKNLHKCDVYSFGLVLLEILTGRMVTEEGQTGLVKWVQSFALEDCCWEVFDFELLSCKHMKDEMVALLEVALLCLAPLPKDRPKMSTVQKMIEDITDKSGRVGPNSFLNDLSSDSSPSLSEHNENYATTS